MIEVRQYVDHLGRNYFRIWLEQLDVQSRFRIDSGIEKLSLGNPGDAKGVGEGVQQIRFHFGPGFRVYFAQDGEQLILLLGGGSKQRQERDIADAKQRWREYRATKRK